MANISNVVFRNRHLIPLLVGLLFLWANQINNSQPRYRFCAKHESVNAKERDEIDRRTLKYLDDLTANDLKQLLAFATRRMGPFSRSGISAEDMLQKALTAILRGQGEGIGRRPQSKDVGSKEAFTNYVRGAINSVTEAFYRKRELMFIHEIVHSINSHAEEHGLAMQGAPYATEEHLGLLDLKKELFQRLKERAPQNLQKLIEEWEIQFLWCSEIPILKNRKHRYALRKLAAEVLWEIERDLR